MLGAALAAVLAGGGWLYVAGIQHQNETLRIQVQDLKKATEILNRNNSALGDELEAAQARATYYQNLKEKVNAAAPGPVPADIRAALDGLRNPRRH